MLRNLFECESVFLVAEREDMGIAGGIEEENIHWSSVPSPFPESCGNNDNFPSEFSESSTNLTVSSNLLSSISSTTSDFVIKLSGERSASSIRLYTQYRVR